MNSETIFIYKGGEILSNKRYLMMMLNYVTIVEFALRMNLFSKNILKY